MTNHEVTMALATIDLERMREAQQQMSRDLDKLREWAHWLNTRP